MPAYGETLSIWLCRRFARYDAGDEQKFLQVLSGKNIETSLESIDNHCCILLLLDGEKAAEESREFILEKTGSGSRILALEIGERSLPQHRVIELLEWGVDGILPNLPFPQIGDMISARLTRWQVIDRIMRSDKVCKSIVGTCEAFIKTLRRVVEISCFSNAPVLILGESGTGKELIARLVHELDRRQDKQSMVLLDCTTIVPELSGSEFFGHEKGAFTNAMANRDGAFALADRGTLFLDEIGELPLRLQAELLRAIQEKTYKRVGSNTWKKTDFRLICATNRNLEKEVDNGAFRQDLYFRLSSCVVKLPSLRERREDIPLLAEHFLKELLQTDLPPYFDAYSMNFLMTHPYPGNVRQLRQIVARIAASYPGKGPVTLSDIPDIDRSGVDMSAFSWKRKTGFHDAIRMALANGTGLKDIKRVAGDIAMDIAMNEAYGNIQEAARKLDISDRTLQMYIAEKGKSPD
jgi:transcriptional regulator with GAF, ATPase, and Fis domain